MKNEDTGQYTVVDLLKHQQPATPGIAGAIKGPDIPGVVTSDDMIAITFAAEDLSKTSITLKGPVPFRVGRVAAIRARIATGTYAVDSREVAEKIIAAFAR